MIDYRAAIQALNLKGSQVVVAGGSNGIGKSLALLYASLGCSVAIIGRTPSTGEATLSQLKKITVTSESGDKQRVAFFQADLSLVTGVRKAAEDVAVWAGEKGIQYLFQTQGVAPPAKPIKTSESFETYFATQALSRFALPYFLFSKSALHATSTIASIALAGLAGKYQPSASDLDLSIKDKSSPAGFGERGQNACAIIDCFTKEFSLLHPQAKFHHIFPGIVRTTVITGAANTPWWMKAGTSFVSAIPGLASSPEETAEMVAYVASGQAGSSLCWNEKAKLIPLGDVADVDTTRKVIWECLVQIVESRK